MAAEPGLADAVLLAPLTEDSFLHNLHLRYKQDVIYTYVGNALVSVNPCRALPLYSADLVRSYLARPPYTLPPHLYAITATAYRWVRDRNESQCIVITGESGAGKTEAARVCLQCAVLAGGGGGAGGPGGRLTAAGTLLEAFGNAATARNHNASRFGKLLDVELDFRGEPIGGHITHYLLEKERACGGGVSEGERNFHVLYQLLAGADVALLKRLKLQRSWEHYRVLRARAAAPSSPRRCLTGAGAGAGAGAAQADRDHFGYTTRAMGALGFGAAQRAGVLRLLAFLLKLGNVQFEPTHNIDGSLGARLRNEYELEEACALVGVAADELAAAFGASTSSLDASVSESSYSWETQDTETDGEETETETETEGEAEEDGAGWARARRDRLLSALYSRLFTWLVTAANRRLRVGVGVGAGAGAALSILDMYGLESLAQNGLERLVINYAAERVQAAVTAATLRREQDEYRAEGLAWTPLRFTDHDAGADLLDAGADSVLGALRVAPSDAAFLQRLQRRRHPRLLVLPPDHFQVVHFGGPVVYSARGMVCKNRDAVCRRAAAALARAADPLLAALFPLHPPHHLHPHPHPHPHPHQGHSNSGSPRHGHTRARGWGGTQACRQRALVTALVRRLPPAPRLVRCLRADAALRPLRFDHALLRHQLRTQGIIEMALLRRAGWCESMCARELVARYGLLAPPPPAAAPPPGPDSAGSAPASPAAGGGVREARALLRALPIPGAEFAYGRSKVFIRSPRTVWELEARRAARVSALVAAAQRAWRRHLARRRHRAQAVIARAWRSHTARRRGSSARSGAAQTLGRAPAAAAAAAESSGARRALAAAAVWRWWATAARRRYLAALWRRLPARHRSPACAAWPACELPALLARTDRLLQALHHRWRCRLYRAAFDQTARNRMREKVTASVLFSGRKALYARSVAHPFVGDYVRLRASGAWRRGGGAGADRYVVFADVVRKVARASGRAARVLAVLSTHALLLLDARSLRLKRRLPARNVYRLSLSPHRDDLLVVHVRACSSEPCGSSSAEEASQCSARGGGGGGGGAGGAREGGGCLFGALEGGRRGDLVLRTCHVLELATKLFLVVQNAAGAPPHVNIAQQFEANFGGQTVTVTFHAAPAALPGAAGAGVGAVGEGGEQGEARLVRRGSRLDVLL